MHLRQQYEPVVVANNPMAAKLSVHALLAAAALNDIESACQQLPPILGKQLQLCHNIRQRVCRQCFDGRVAKCAPDLDPSEVLMELHDWYRDINTFCLPCVEQLKRMDDQIYAARISELMAHTEYWGDFFEAIFEDQPSSIANWDFKALTRDQALVLRNHPYEAPEFCDEEVTVLQIAHMVSLDHSERYCADCIGARCSGGEPPYKMITVSQCTRMEMAQLFDECLRNDQAWCSICRYSALFDFVYSDYYHMDIHYFGFGEK